MNWLTSLIAGLKSLFQKQRVERELDEELEGYLEAALVQILSMVGVLPVTVFRIKPRVQPSRMQAQLDL